jgi:hypothetical protein
MYSLSALVKGFETLCNCVGGEEMDESGSVGAVLALERRLSSGELSVATRPLEELPLWSWLIIAGRKSEKCPDDPLSATGLVAGDSTEGTGLIS